MEAFIRSHEVLIIFVGMSIYLLIHFFDKRTSRPFAFDLTFHFAFIILAITAFVIFLSEERIELKHVAVFLYVYGVALYVLLCELLLRGFARFLTAKRGERWVKELDYIYLTLGSLGILGSINRLDIISGRFSKVDILAPLVLVTAVVIRFIKTRAEINGWNKPPDAKSRVGDSAT